MSGGRQVRADVMALAAITSPSSQVHPEVGPSAYVARAWAIALAGAALVFLPRRPPTCGSDLSEVASS